MGRRRKSKDAAVFEAISGLAGFGVLLGLISPKFRWGIEILLLSMVIMALVILAIWFAYKAFRPESSLTSFRAVDGQPSSCLITTQSQESVKKPPTIQPVPKLTISEQLRKIDWFQFEKLMELIYLRRGFSVRRMGGANPDGGADLIIESAGEKSVVQCKHWKKWTIGVRHIREFLGTLTDHGIPNGIFITLTGYSGAAKQLAEKHGIRILNETDVVKMLEESGLMYSREVSALFSDSRKFCPKCEHELVLRHSRASGNPFWGCSTYPRCKFTMKLDGENNEPPQSRRRAVVEACGSHS